ncbi:putative AlkP superfamily phosphohydrolase/phosphomutase [Mycoplana sp. BE70]|uniref:hypothetical protein n=1 Tax=Mycoplana sp. BE70 TaxID=2817775 RepID=UPI00285F02A1|nr:hypothetical protein [Mycoplana sp. BE70]MDR6759235.1 putative AlkP superfamily phosphohydrolase/phosphomutase [Mycoplana sp. BE70]
MTVGLLLDQDVEDALAQACGDFKWKREYAIALIIREWLEESGYLMIRDPDPDGLSQNEA